MLAFNRSKRGENVSCVMKDTAIIMQGPLIAKDFFTVETVKLYARLYP